MGVDHDGDPAFAKVRFQQDGYLSCWRRIEATGSFRFSSSALRSFGYLAVAGAVSAYSPVPFSDMWNGYLDFFVRASSGDWPRGGHSTMSIELFSRGSCFGSIFLGSTVLVVPAGCQLLFSRIGWPRFLDCAKGKLPKALSVSRPFPDYLA